MFIILFSSFVSADIKFDTTTDYFPYNIKHGEQATFQIELTNTNSICNIICDYSLFNTNTAKTEESRITITTSTPYPYSKIFTVPDYSTTLITYNLFFWCSDSSSCLFGKEYSVKTYSIDITPKLNDAEVAAKSFIETNLKNNEAKLEEVSASLQKLNNKITNLKSNVKIGNVKYDYDSYNQKFDLVNYNVKQVDDLYGTAHYIEAQKIFDLNQFNSILDIKTNIEILSTKIDEIVKRHNEDAEKIEKLNDLINSNQKLATVVNKQQEFNDIQKNINLLATNFNNGNFNTYDEIETLVNIYTNQINDLKSKWSQLLVSILTSGNTLLDEESSSLCQNKAICSFSKISLSNDIKDLDNICNTFNLISGKFEEIFKDESFKYDLYIKNITELNDKIKEDNGKIISKNKEIENENSEIKNLNIQIQTLNELTKQINELIENNHISIDSDNCADFIKQVQSNKTINIINSAMNECTKTKNGVNQVKIEKEKSFTFKFKRLFFFLTSFKFNEISKVDEIPFKDLLPLKEELKITSETPIKLKFKEDTLNFQSKYCNIKEAIEKLYLDKSRSSEAGEIKQQVNINFKEQEEQCCWLGVCKPCCKSDECRNDEKSYPIIFLHGHSFKKWDAPEYSLAAFDNIQLYLIENGYVSRGILLPTDDNTVIPKGSWGKSNQPSTVKVTYYLKAYNKQGQLINEPSKSDSIEDYAERLNNLIELTKDATNRAKVNIIAHSMGGLVAREYIKEFGSDSVNKLIMIGTPNHGIYGSTDSFCGVFGAATECKQMSSTNNFIENLKEGDETPYNIKYYTIAGTGCGYGEDINDGIVRTTSVPLNGATNYKVSFKKDLNSACIDMHSNLLNPNKYPEVLDYVKKILAE